MWTDGGSQWLGALSLAEITHEIPTNLLARVAYEESHWRDEIIRGTLPSPAGALGIMQLMPRYFQSVRVPIPFADGDVYSQIDEAASFLSTLYKNTKDWTLAIAAYNAGLSAVEHAGGIPDFPETQRYVAEITADVPVPEANA